MDEIEQKGQMLDQEKVTRVYILYFSLCAARNTCIVNPRYLVATVIKIEI